jgi:hypothetical protein
MKNFIILVCVLLAVAEAQAQEGCQKEQKWFGRAIDPEYHTFEELWVHLDSLSSLYPEIFRLDTLGFSQFMQLPIPVVKISENPEAEEDEPAILYDGMHHAREPVGMECCLEIMEYLLSQYSTNPQVKQWIDNAEIFIIPCLNPDGWKYNVDSFPNNPMWRKNMRDNNGNGIFEPGYDGVDLNRNYDFWWEYGDPDPFSEAYRGPAPFSETETIAKRNLVVTQKPVLSISYHSWGETVLYVKYVGYSDAPDWPVMYEVANHIAGLIPGLTTGTYTPGLLDGTWSQSPNWAYQFTGTMEILIETADQFIPPGPQGQQIAADNLAGALYLPERVFQSGITGHVTAAPTGEPLRATVELVGTDNNLIEPRTSDSLYGRYFRLLLPGTYTVRAFAENTDTATAQNIVVTGDTLTVVDFELNQLVGMESERITNYELRITNNPNPFAVSTTLNYTLPEPAKVVIRIYNSFGQLVAEPLNTIQTAGEQKVQWNAGDLPAGMYYYRVEADGRVGTGKMVKW